MLEEKLEAGILVNRLAWKTQGPELLAEPIARRHRSPADVEGAS